MTAPRRSILWFRRDLRLLDNPALTHASRDGGEVVPVFVIDPALVRPSGANRLAYLYRSLRELNDSIGGRLIVRHGDPVKVIPSVASATLATEVVVTRDYAPYGRRRDAATKAALTASDVEFVGAGTPYAVAPGTVVKADGSPYAVFTPFFRSWDAVEKAAPIGQHTDVRWHAAGSVSSDAVPDDPETDSDLPPAGERAAHDRWDAFVADGLDCYDTNRDLPAIAGSSGMSPYLRWGHVHPRQLLVDLGDSPPHAAYRRELAWRDFYADVLFRAPQSARENLERRMDVIEIDTDGQALDRFDAWKQGLTGYSIIDAGMRQLLATGWMHNRVRMLTASFLVKDLHLPWQWGARHFMQYLVDGDLASNQHGWQWVAGTGTDAAPYFRIFNPTTQVRRFDPDEQYVRRWLPDGTVAPIVDHAAERAEALRRHQAVAGR